MSENQISDEDSRLEKLALRLLVHPGDPQVNKARLFLGQIPASLPVEVPIPERSQVLGTLARSEENIEIVLASDLQPEEILSFYRERLKPQGWNELEDVDMHHMGGFLHSNLGPANHVTFYQSPQSASLTLNVMQLEGTTTDIRLTLDLSEENNQWIQQARMQRQMRRPNHYETIPPLTQPAGAQQRGGGGSSGSDEASTSAKLKTNLEIDAVLKHYTNQLSRGGWVKTDEGASGPLAWNTWKFTDEEQQPWRGLFFILKTPEKQEDYFLFVRTVWDRPENSKHSGWMSSSGSFRTKGSF